MDIGIVHPQLIYPKGAEKQIAYLSYYLKKEGHDVTIYTFEKKRDYIFDKYLDGVKVVSLDKKWFITPSVINIPRWYFLSKRLSEKIENHDIINYHNFPANWISNFVNIPSVWTINEPPFPNGNQNPLLDKLLPIPLKFDKYMSKNIKTVFCLDSKMKNLIKDKYYPEKEIIILRSGAELDEKIIHKNNGFFNILFVGPIIFNKRPIDIFKAVSKIKSNKHYKIHIVGEIIEMNLFNEIKEIIAENNLNTEFYSNISDEKLYELYSIADLSIYTPLNHPWGVFPLETILSGIPTILCDECGAIEIFDKNVISDFVVKFEDIEELSSKIVEIESNYNDFLEKTKILSKVVHEDYSWEAYSKKVFDYFLKILK